MYVVVPVHDAAVYYRGPTERDDVLHSMIG